MEKGFKTLRGIRIIVSLPKRPDGGVPLLPETQKEVDREFAMKCDRMKVYAIGDAVEGISEGDEVYIPYDERLRGSYITINGEDKMIISSMAVTLIW